MNFKGTVSIGYTSLVDELLCWNCSWVCEDLSVGLQHELNTNYVRDKSKWLYTYEIRVSWLCSCLSSCPPPEKRARRGKREQRAGISAVVSLDLLGQNVCAVIPETSSPSDLACPQASKHGLCPTQYLVTSLLISCDAEDTPTNKIRTSSHSSDQNQSSRPEDGAQMFLVCRPWPGVQGARVVWEVW